MNPGERLHVVATTNLVADIVAAVGGESIELTALLPLGSDPHSYAPIPADYRAVLSADVIFINGAGLEEFIPNMVEQAGGDVRVVSLSEGIEFRRFDPQGVGDGDALREGGHAGEAAWAGVDPHVWFDPGNVMIWAENAAAALGALDPSNADKYAQNAQVLIAELQELDVWIAGVIAAVPPQDRLLVTDHLSFGYFADRFAFEMVGAILPAYSSLAEPSAYELAELVDEIQKLNVEVIFVSSSVNPRLAERLSEDVGAEVVQLYIGSFSEPGGPISNYFDLIRYDVNAIAAALRE
jgi:ABC-type Zn uptake system ZnuABC Zn-binding protein ZnuA